MSTDPHIHDEPVEPRRRRFAAVAVAAAVLLAGGGGAYWASTAMSGGEPGDAAAPVGPGGSGEATPPKIALDGYGGERAAHSGQAYRAQGPLPDGPDRAPVYRGTGSPDKKAVAELATALGVKSAPELKQSSWMVSDGKDGMGPALRVTAEEPGDWSYSRYAQDGDTPASSGEPQQKPVSEQRARRAAAPVLKALGLGDATVDTGSTVGALRMVQAEPRVGELPTHGWQTGITVGSDGQLVRANGKLGRLTRGADYPVLSAGEALKALNKSSSGASGIQCVRAPCEPGPADQQGPLKVTAAEFGLAAHSSKGRQLLLPSWLFQVEQGQSEHTVAYPAVEPRYLAPRPVPGSEPGKPPAAPAEPGEPGRPGGAGQSVESYSSKDRELTLHFWGGVCSDYSASADETKNTVKVTVTARDKEPGQICIKIAKAMTVKVTLDQPVGDRTVVDADGNKIPKK
ncbi:hypothetical protein [Streptomyces gobiensis]|uniref:hypothetical protein n=1 Tax=Streptomyces gobiensis TaxID=2875706 RepID=UPI001E4BB25D|nr:hypothetical protein [Streptomyces gobiensis]UGY90943.1 hypothetical protein test1122_03850 [Streptomyces gobiensis]